MSTCPKCGTRYGPTTHICTQDGTVLEADSAQDAQVGKVLDGKYRLEAFISQGGMGSVYRATHVMLGRSVAVKLIKPELVTSPDIVRRFQREARAASNLNHPNIVGVYDLGQTEDGTLYIAMELIDGPSMHDVIRRSGPLPVARLTRILRQVASALSLAHRHNIVHRDLKPHNVMLAKDADGNEVAKLLDFGIAKTFDDSTTQLTMTGFALGTPQYMSPEQVAGKAIDARCDLYSLGIILYEALVGEVPFTDPSTSAILVKQLTEAPTPPSLRNPAVAVPPALEAIALRCLEKDPANRFQTADEFAAALDRVAGSSATRRESELATTVLPVVTADSTIPSVTAPERAAPGAAPTTASAQTRTAAPGQSPAPAVAAPTAGHVVPSAVPPIAPTAQPTAAVSSAPAAPAAASSGTRPTVPAPAEPVPVSPASLAVPAPSAKSSTVPIAIAAVAVLVIVVAGAYQFGYLPWPAGRQTTPQARNELAPNTEQPAPSGTPAMAGQRAEPVAPTGAGGAAAQTAPSPPGAGSSATQVPTAPTGAPAASARPAEKPGAAPPRRESAPASATAAAPLALAQPGAPQTRAQQSAVSALPENPPVFSRCTGPAEICSAVLSAMDHALEREHLPNVRDPNRAQILLTVSAAELEQRTSQQFGTTFVTRTYSVSVDGESRAGDVVPMPSARTFSFDSQFGRERLPENARVIADDVAERVRAFWKKRLQ